MQIDKDILIAWGGKLKKFSKNETIFSEGQEARCYHQILEGSVRMFNINDTAGKEFTQGMFGNNNSFGEPPLIIDEVYPAHAVAITDSVIIILPKESFLKILNEYPEIHMRFTRLLAQRVWDKAITFKELMSNAPATRILGFLRSYKKKIHAGEDKILIPFTRQEIANFTGLRVETAIRTLNRLNDENQVEIRNRKLYF